MSDPAWLADAEVAGTEGIIYVQAAGAGAPGTADELGYGTATSEEHTPNTSERTYINVSSTQESLNSYTHSGTISIGYGSGAQAPRQLILTAIANKSRLKFTIIAGPTATGEISVYDNCVVGFTRSGDPGEGWTGEISFTGTWVGTAATDA
jgi:hypothetical protein